MLVFMAPLARIRLLLAAWVMVFAPGLATAGSMVWATDGTQLYQVDADSKTLVRTLTFSGIVAKSLSADGNGGVWFADAASVRHVSSNGTQQSQTLLSALGLASTAGPVVIAADPTDGTAWAGAGGAVVQLRADGSKGVPITLAGQTLVALRVGLNHKPWLLTNALLFQATVDGSAFPFTDVVQVAGTTPKALAVDVQGTAAWVALNSSSAGGASYVLKLDHGTSPFTRLQVASGPASFVAANAVSGDLWAYSPVTGISAASLQRFSRAGALLQTSAQPTGGDGMDVDSATGIVWEGQTTGLRALAADGSVLATLNTGTSIRGVSVTAYRPVPSGGATPPVLSAPPIDKTVPSLLANTTAFLYTGSNPVQTGVTAGVIDTKRAAVVRGKVLTRDGTPLPGVTVQVLNHPELGKTVSRADGMFDMAVNGGGQLTLQYTGTGYLPVQRQVTPRWQGFAVVEDVSMIGLDNRVTAIDTSSSQPFQVAQGNVVTDKDGTRQATLLFPQGTTASMVFADGHTQPLTSLHVRATEYTVGANGPASMPGPLPPSSGYTYAVELSVDEAIAANATRVQFSRSVPLYVDNFLAFPVGTVVPLGWYDRQKAAWVPSDNGRVIKILAVTNGQADIDADGDGVADDANALAAIGVTSAERKQLATLYAVGKTLWRSQVTHFTPWDCNLPIAPPPDSRPPRLPSPAPVAKVVGDYCEKTGSILECQNQTLGERVPVTGTPFSLNYRSDRVPGHNEDIRIPLSGADLPTSLRRIELSIDVAGTQVRQTFAATPNQTFVFRWNGQDAYGRTLVGDQRVFVRIGYVYPLIYLSAPRNTDQSFAQFGNAPIGSLIDRGEFVVWQDAEVSVRPAQSVPLLDGLGGWTLDVHHALDPAGVVYYGDGSRGRPESAFGNVVSTVAGNGTFRPVVTGVPPTQTALDDATGVAFAPDGSLYIASSGTQSIYRVGASGLLERFAGNGTAGYSGDGGPAATARFGNNNFGLSGDMAFAPDGSLFVADTDNHVVRRIGADGVITTVAGNGQQGFSGDQGPAVQASLSSPHGIALAPDGTLYIADRVNGRVRKVDPNGRISTIAGTGYRSPSSGDGGPAALAGLGEPAGLALDRQGALYVADLRARCVRRIDRSGMIGTHAGICDHGFQGGIEPDLGSPATSMHLNHPYGLAAARDGSLYLSDGSGLIYLITPDDRLLRFAGGGAATDSLGDGGLANAASFDVTYGLALAPDGALHIADPFNDRIRRVSPYLASFGHDVVLASSDGSQLFVFDVNGRHLKTVDAHTGALRYAFSYTAAGLLDRVTDGDGNVTRIERSANGSATAIVAADGQRTQLGYDTNGWLNAVADPLGQTHTAQYTPLGLLTRLAKPSGAASTMQYDPSGRLLLDVDAAGGSWTLSRATDATGFTASLRSAEGRSTSYRVTTLPSGDEQRINTAPDGSITQSIRHSDGSSQLQRPDNSWVTIRTTADPRWGAAAAYESSRETRLPSGLVQSVTVAKTASLRDPADAMSLVQELATLTLNGRSSTAVYDAASRTLTATSAVRRTQVVRTDAAGRLSSVQVGNLDPVTYAYDPRGRLSGMSQGAGTTARSLTYAYGTDGFLQSVTDALGNTVLYQRDAVGRPTSTTLPGSRVLRASFDANGNTTTLTPPSRPAHGFGYTPVDLETQYSPPALTGITDPSSRFTYNRDKDLTGVSLPDGSSLALAYEASGGRLLSVTPSAGAGNAVSYGYTAGTGQLSNVSNADAILSITYDGPLAKQETMTGSVPGSISRTFDNDFRVTQQTVNGTATSYSYDGDSLLTQAGALTLVRDVATGLLSTTSLGTVATSQGYNTFGELQSFAATFNGGTLYTYNLSYDRAGRISGKTETIGGVTTQFAYGYDIAGRLATVSRNGTQTASYGYDANGNRTTVNGLVIASFDAQDRLLNQSGVSYLFTANGALKSKAQGAQNTSYRYDAFGNLKAVDLPSGMHIDYLADGANRRIGKKVNGALVQGFVYENQLRVVAELNGAGAVVSNFVYGDKVNVPEFMVKGGATFRIVTDHLGSVRQVVNTATGAIAQRIDYDEWGNVTNDTSPGFQPFGFAGGLYDRDTKLVRFGARDYDASVGRWTAKDPIRFGAGDVNLYAYAFARPADHSDPTGLIVPIPVITGAIGAIASGAGYALGRWAQGCDIKGSDLAIAIGVGALAGAAAPLGGGLPGAMALGALGNVAQDGIGSWLAGTEMGWSDVGKSAMIGAVSGAVGGAYTRVGKYGYQGTGASRQMVDSSNAGRELRANVNTGNFLRNLTGSSGSTAAGCDCR